MDAYIASNKLPHQKKVRFECAFCIFLLVHFGSLFSIRILTFSFDCFNQIPSLWCQEPFREEMTSSKLVFINHFGFFSQGPPWSSTKVAAELQSLFHHSPEY